LGLQPAGDLKILSYNKSLADRVIEKGLFDDDDAPIKGRNIPSGSYYRTISLGYTDPSGEGKSASCNLDYHLEGVKTAKASLNTCKSSDGKPITFPKVSTKDIGRCDFIMDHLQGSSGEVVKTGHK